MSTNISILILADVLKMLSYITKFKWSYFRKKDWLWKWVKVKLLSHVRLSVTLWTVAYQASWTMGFSKQEYWSRLPFPSPDYGSEFPTNRNAKPLWTYLLLLLLLCRFSRVWLCATPKTAAHQALPSLGFSRQEYWGGLPFPSPEHIC